MPLWFLYHKRYIIFKIEGWCNMSQKTNAARILDKSKTSYELKEYTADESDLSAITWPRM